MLGNFSYCNPTRLYFGEDSMNHFKKELEHYGGNVLLCYGGGSIKKNGIYDQVIAVLKECGKTVMEDPGVMPNPTVEKLREGIQRARDCKAVRSAITQRQFPYQFTVRKTRGRSIISVLRNLPVKSFPWAAC